MGMVTLTKPETLHQRKVRAGSLGGSARARNLSPEELSAIGRKGGRPRALNYSDLILREREKENKRRNQQNSEHMACNSQPAALKKIWQQKRKEVISRTN